MPLRTDLLLGVEALRALFPNDSLTRFFIPPSVLASIPEPLTVELEFDPITQTAIRINTKPEGHLPRQRRPATMVAALDAMDQVDNEICQQAVQASAVYSDSE